MALPSPPPTQQSILSPVRGRNTNLFQPPKSPATLAATPSYATSADYFTHGGSRKRSRADSSANNRYGVITTPGWTTRADEGSMLSSTYGQDSLHVNERYRLAGGFDTPGLMANHDLDHTSDQEINARRRIMPRQPSYRSSSQAFSGPLARERNGMARMPGSPNGTTSWTRFAFNLVGKAFSFGTTVFKGFVAGGGTGYEYNEKQAFGRASPVEAERTSTPLPGSWHTQDFLGDFEQNNPEYSPSSTQRPPNKRRQTDRDAWVLVGTPDITEASPKRKSSSIPVPTTRPSASRASSRRSLVPTATRRQTTYTGNPALTQDRRASVALTRSPGSRPSSSGRPSSGGAQAYLSPEAERFVKRQAKQDRAADKAMSTMSKQLEDLIRQGQQALGTKFSVENGGNGGEEMDEGFVDEEGW